MSFAAIAIAGTVASVGMGTAQMISANKGRRRAELEAKAQNSPIYKPSKSIESFYQEAKNRYQESPYQSEQYQVGARNIRQSMASGVAGLQDRRSAIGGINRLAGAEANAMQNLAASAEAQRAQRFNQLGQASQAMAGEQRMEFDINKQTPYNRQLQLAQWRAQSAFDQEQAGLGTIGNALSNLGSYAASAGMAKGAAKPTSTPLTGQAGFDSFMANRGQAPMPPMSNLSPKVPFFGQSTGNLYNYRPIKYSKL
jgi:hypothetical protein